MNSEWYYVKNWWKFQDSRFSRPKWIRLWKDIEHDPAFQELPEIIQWRLVKLWLYAAEIDGRLPRDHTKIGRRLGLYHQRSCDDLIAIFISKGFISIIDIRKSDPHNKEKVSKEKQPPIPPSLESELFGSSSETVSPNGNHKKDAAKLWEYYIQKTGKNPKVVSFTKAREQKGVSRLLECMKKTDGDSERAIVLMQGCIDALVASDFHMGANDQKKRYDSWEKHLFPNQEKMEWWLERAVAQ